MNGDLQDLKKRYAELDDAIRMLEWAWQAGSFGPLALLFWPFGWLIAVTVRRVLRFCISIEEGRRK